MELHVFMTCDEFVSFLNVAVEEAECSVFVAESRDARYETLDTLNVERLLASRNIELGFVSGSDGLTSKAVKDIYREDRVGFVSVHPGCKAKSPDVLVETTFVADSSENAKAIFKVLRKVASRMFSKGVRAVNEKSGDVTLLKSFYWTPEAAKSKKIWRQVESSYVRFEPVQNSE